MKLSDYKKKLEGDKKENLKFNRDLAFHIGLNIELARIDKGWTQEELARKIGTKQPSIARIESGRLLPSLRFLKNIAEALDTYLIPPTFSSLSDQLELQKIEVNAKNTYQSEYDLLPYQLLKNYYVANTQTQKTKNCQILITSNN